MNRVSKMTAWLGALLLFLGAGFHLTALGFVKEEATKIENAFLANALEPVWIFPSTHWLVFGLIGAMTVLRPSSISRAILLVIAVGLGVDAALAASALGPFAGAIILGIASFCFVVAGLTLRPVRIRT